MQNIAARGDSLPVARSVRKRAFARHFAEMIVVMLLGMGVLEALAAVAFAVAGSSLSDQPGALPVTLMGLSMTVPMVFWMRHRGHAAGVMLWRCEEYARPHAAPRGDLPGRAYRNEPATTRVPGT